jgi:hypothetical protein
MSIKVCIISPASHLDQYSILGDCEMALTHLIVPDAGFHHSSHVKCNYVNYFKKRSEENKWTILDNSAYEIGKLESTSASGQGLGPELVLQAAEMINPSIVIAQDVLCDRHATLESTKAFIKYVEDKGLLGKFDIMAVPQGKTEDEWLMSYEELSALPQVDQIGLSKISVPLSFGGTQSKDGCVATARLECTSKIHAEFFLKNKSSRDLQVAPQEYGLVGTQWARKHRLKYTGPKPAHLLGGDNQLPWELSQQKRYPWIFSNDSSATVQYGLKGKKFDPHTGTIENIITEKPDLENNIPFTIDYLVKYSDHILHNIALLHRWSK